ncbi:M28 family peptidase [Altererythrobacter sp. CAU 1778]
MKRHRGQPVFAIRASAGLLTCILTSSAWTGGDLQAQEVTKRPFMQPVEVAKSGQAAWFGLRLPGAATDPVDGPVQSAEDVLPPRPASVPSGPRGEALSGKTIRADLAKIIGFSHESRDAGDYLWGRITGRPAFDRTMAWVEASLREAGLGDVRQEPFAYRDLHLPVSGEVRLLADNSFGEGSADIVLRSAMVGGNGPVDGVLEAPLAYLGQGLDAEIAGRDLAGRIAVVVSTPSPSLYAALPASRIPAVLAAGAAGVIEIQIQPGNLQNFDRDRHGCGPGMCFTLGGEDGYFLQNLLGSAARSDKIVRARLTAKSETLAGAAANVVATIPGRSERTIVVVAHADGWFGGADDNGSGLAVLLALARHFKQQPQLERTIVFLASAGHHSATVNGPLAFRKMHGGDLLAKADLILNIEHPAQAQLMRSYLYRQADNFGAPLIAATGDLPKQVAVSNGAPFLIDLWRQGAQCFGLELQRRIDSELPGDLNAFADLESVPRTQMIASGGVYHTSGDDLWSVPAAALERAARFHAFFIAAAADAPASALHGGPWSVADTCEPQTANVFNRKIAGQVGGVR